MAGRRTKRTRALVLDTTKLGEQDLILTLLGETGVQLRAVAKGARKPTFVNYHYRYKIICNNKPI